MRDDDNENYPGYIANCERAVVGRALINPEYWSRAGLGGHQFCDPKLGEVWDMIGELHLAGAEVSEAAVCSALDSRARLKYVGGFAAVSQLPLVDGPATSGPDFIRNAWLVREAKYLTVDIPTMLRQGLSGDEILGQLRNRIDELTEGNTRSVTSLGEAGAQEIAHIRADYEKVSCGIPLNVGLPTGLGLEQYVPGGIPRDKLTLLFGETGTYKTALKQNLIDAIALGSPEGRILDFSLEDSIQLTTQRFLARISGVPYGRIATRELEPGDLARINAAFPAARAAADRVHVVGDVPGSIEEALRLVQQFRKDGLVAVFLDYIQLVSTEWDEIVQICTKMQRSAKVDKVAWVAISQLKQDRIDAREDKKPWLSDCYGGPGMKMCPKLAVGVYRPSQYVKEPGPKNRWHVMYHNAENGAQQYENLLELIIRKNVVGETNVSVPVLVDRPSGRMVPYQEPCTELSS